MHRGEGAGHLRGHGSPFRNTCPLSAPIQGELSPQDGPDAPARSAQSQRRGGAPWLPARVQRLRREHSVPCEPELRAIPSAQSRCHGGASSLQRRRRPCSRSAPAEGSATRVTESARNGHREASSPRAPTCSPAAGIGSVPFGSAHQTFAVHPGDSNLPAGVASRLAAPSGSRLSRRTVGTGGREAEPDVPTEELSQEEISELGSGRSSVSFGPWRM